jgi:hypothetical protein
MNIALGTVILFVIIVPGIIMRRFYYTEEFSRKYIRNSIVDEMVFAIVPAFLIHFFAIVIIHQFTPYYIDFDTLAILLTNSGNEKHTIKAFHAIRDNMSAILCYNFTLWNGAAIIGFMARIVIRKNKLDRKYKFLKYGNDWHYLLTGEFTDFPKINGNSESIDLIFVDALTKADGKNVIYTGILVDYKLAAAGVLDFLILKEAKRIYTSEKSPGITNSINIPGDYFIVLYNQILNINLTYYKLEEEDTATE